MKKTLLVLSALALSLLQVQAQTPKVETSAAFDEPEGLESKVIQCRNGNTFLFTFTKKDGINSTLYDKSRKVINTQTLEGTGVWDRKDMIKSEVEGIYEINNQLVIFLEQVDARTPYMYRIVLDPATGKVVEEKKIAEMPKYGAGAGYAMAFAHVDPKTFYVEKDPESDCYAIISFDGFASETDNRIGVLHFNGKHELINEAQYSSPENKYKYTRYIGMTVDGDKQVFLCSYSFNTTASGGKASKVYVSRLKAGSKEMEHHPLDMTQDFKNTEAIMQYNPHYKTIQLLTLSLLGSDQKVFSNTTTTSYRALLTAIDPQSMVVLYSKPIGSQTLSQYKRNSFDDKKPFSGLPQDILIHDDNSITVVLEEQTVTYRSSGMGMAMGGGQQSGAFMGDMGILSLDDKGNEKAGFVIQKDQKTRFPIPALSMHDRRRNYVGFERKPGFGGYANTGFYSYDYIVTPNHEYIIFNDHPDNFKREEKKKRQNVVAISESNTICYKDVNDKTEKFYLLGAPASADETRFSFISAAHYLPETHTYATLMIHKDGRKKEAQLAWVELQ